MVMVGELAPEIDATTSEGAPFKLSSFRGQKNVVVFFYPGDFTPVCTKEACGFRDIYAELRSQDTEVVGISNDSDESHRKFARAHDLGFPLVSDPDRAIAQRYGATGWLTRLLGRVNRATFLVAKDGRIAAIIDAQLSAHAHLAGVRDALAKLAGAASAGG